MIHGKTGLGLAAPVKSRRLFFLVLVMAIAFGGMGYRLVEVQVLRHDVLSNEARTKTSHTMLLEARRGEIRDRYGNLLATSVFVKTVCVNPEFVGVYQKQVAKVLAPLLRINEADLAHKLRRRTYVNHKGETKNDPHVILKRKVSVDLWKRIQAAMMNLSFDAKEIALSGEKPLFFSTLRRKAIFAEAYEDQVRVYPGKPLVKGKPLEDGDHPLAPHVLGYVRTLDRNTVLGPVRELNGANGVEFRLNEVLRGDPGWRTIEVVPKGELVPFRKQDVQSHAGRNVFLTLDSRLQRIVESELAGLMLKHDSVSASAIIVRPRTGEILAMANVPTFDPNKPGAVDADHWRNRTITDVAEPGSTFKIVAIAAALNEGLVSLDSRFDCEQGHFYFAGRRLKDDHPSGVLTVQDIVAKSSNIGTAKIAIQLGAERLYEYIRRFGFGIPTGIPLLGEVKGILHPTSKWSRLSISRIPIGQGIAVTPLQMVMAMSVIANDGVLMRPMLVDRVEDDQGKTLIKYYPHKVRRVVHPVTARKMVAALRKVVEKNGTARRARLDNYFVAGKTGTAQKPIRGGYSHSKFFSSFVGFFPANSPELCISVVLDEPKRPSYYASSTAAPAFRRIAEKAAKYLALKPDIIGSAGAVVARADTGR